MRIAQWENSVEKKGWVAWFTWETNETSRQEVCTTYVGRRSPSVLPKEETLRPPRSDLRSPGKISKLGGFRAPDGDSARVWERATWGDQYFEKLIPILYFPWSTFIHWDVMQKSRGVGSPDFIKVWCFIQMYTEVLGVLHHLLARGPADNLWPSPYESCQSTRTLISPGVIILKKDSTVWRYQIKLHSYRVRV